MTNPKTPDVISETYGELTGAIADLAIAQLHNRWYHARLTELLAALGHSHHDASSMHPELAAAVKNANNLLDGVDRLEGTNRKEML